MHAHLLCDWTTVRGTSAVSPVPQDSDRWLDVSDYHDLVFWIDCREVTGTVQLHLQTSPSVGDFINMSAMQLSVASGPVVVTALASSALVAASSWLRWQLASSSATWDATFRIWVSANSPGR